jgi:hypothetical protein
MSALKDVIDGLKEVLRMSDDLKRTAEAVKALAIEVREHDRRLVRLETIVEFAQGRSGPDSGRAIESKRD